jgi:hypothetical protein
MFVDIANMQAINDLMFVDIAVMREGQAISELIFLLKIVIMIEGYSNQYT